MRLGGALILAYAYNARQALGALAVGSSKTVNEVLNLEEVEHCPLVAHHISSHSYTEPLNLILVNVSGLVTARQTT